MNSQGSPSVKKKEKLTTSVIICCYADERFNDILEAVASVRRQVPPPEEIILAVDNNRGLFQRLRRTMDSSVRVMLHEGTCGLSATRNAGIGLAQGDLVAFLDDDAVAEPEWLGRLIELFRDPDVVAAGGTAVLLWAKGRPSWFPEELDWTIGGSLNWLPAERTVVRNPHGFNMCFRREVFNVVGGFAVEIGGIRETPRGGEEAELCLRIAHSRPSAKVIMEPSAVVVHKVPANKARFPVILRRAYNEGFYKSWIRHTALVNGGDTALSTERAYLNHLLRRALPSRLSSRDPKHLLQAGAIMLCIWATGVGYVLGEIGNIRFPFREAR